MEVSVDSTGRGNKKWLRLRWTYPGHRRVGLSLGIPDTPINRQQAKKIAATIELDFATGRYDHANYKRNYGLKTQGNKARVIPCPEMFDRFLKAEVSGLSKSGLTKYVTVGNWVGKLLAVDCDRVDAIAVKNFVARLQEPTEGKRRVNNTVKSYLWILRMCWDWAARDYDVATPNPWAVVLPKVKSSRVKDTRAFTSEEIQRILASCYAHPRYCHYGDFLKFLVSIAARPGEVTPLTWGDLSPDFTSVSINKSLSRRELRNTTKNNKPRQVSLPGGTVEMLRDRYQTKKPKPTDLIFPAPKGGAIDSHDFSNRAWRKILGLAGLAHNKLYSLRHTGISHALASGQNIIDVAEQAGNSPKVMADTYAHSVERRSVFKGF